MRKLISFKYTKLILFIFDIAIIATSYILAIVFTNKINQFDMHLMINTIALSVLICETFLNLFEVYRNITMYESAKEYMTYVISCVLGCVLVSLIGFIFKIDLLGIKEILLAFFFAAIIMIFYRTLIKLILSTHPSMFNNNKKKNLLIIGAGNSGRDVIKNIKDNSIDKYNIVGIIDDNPKRLHRKIYGIRVIGNRQKIQAICKEKSVDVIFFAISLIKQQDKKEILAICQETGIKVQIVPGMNDLINNKNILQNLRDIQIEDILGREPIKLDNQNIETLIKNNTIMITGAGGSIGSELSRQIARYSPQKIILLDIYENSLYDIELELKENYTHIEIDAVIASIRDKTTLEKIFKETKPYLVFHAAAHKHVPLMERNPLEAIKNNVFGTYNLVNCSDKYGVKRFVQISTDKAVNPTNIMGATKRMCEMIIQAKNKVSKTEFVAVRFGNVLGSNGSVVPLFKKQIEKGGPVTVTHKDITRFFMTIPEAVQLVLQAITYAKGGEIFVLDMGEPVKIYDLAVNLIKLAGLEPNVDIPIKITGLRPGEKLYEELLMEEEGLTKTEHDKIKIAKPSNITMNELEEKLELWQKIVNNENITLEQVKKQVKDIIPTYKEESSSEIYSFEETEEEIDNNRNKKELQVIS